MKNLLMVLVMLTGTMGFAATSAEVQNEKALSILLKNSDRLTAEDGESITQILAQSLVSSEETSNKIKNSCVVDKTDGDLKCELFILNTDDATGGSKTESATSLSYVIEINDDGSLAEEMFFLTVNVFTAG